MVVPIMVLLFLRGKSDEITNTPSEKRCFLKEITYKKRSTMLG